METKELFTYLQLLVELNKNGYTCNREIAEVIKAIREQFGFAM